MSGSQFISADLPSKSALEYHTKDIYDPKTCERIHRRGGPPPTSNDIIYVQCLRWRTVASSAYLNAYPVVVRALARTSVDVDIADIPPSVISRLGYLEVRPHRSLNLKPWLIATYTNKDGRFQYLREFIVEPTDPDPESGAKQNLVSMRGATAGETYEQFQSKLQDSGGDVPQSEGAEQLHEHIHRITLGILLLASDPEYFRQQLLASDEGKTLTPEQRAAAEAKAVRRGKVAFDLGRDIEMAPHFRRPHFAIRWTEKGRRVPKLVMVKDSVINAKLMTEVPTGYDGDGD